MAKLQVPFNLDPAVLDIYENNKEHISQIYFALHPSIFPSARQQHYRDLDEYNQICFDMCDRMKFCGIDTMLLINGTNVNLTNDLFDKIGKMLNLFIERNLTGVVVANPIIGHWVHENFPTLRIKYSILSNMDSYEKIKLIDEVGYVDEICLPLKFNRDLDFLKKLKETTNINYSIIVNSTCRANCPLYGWHHSAFNSDTNMSDSEFTNVKKSLYDLTSGSKEEKGIRQGLELAAYIPPADLYKYDHYIYGYKLEDRTMRTSDIEKMLFYYINRINPEHMYDCIHGSCLHR